MSEPAAPPAELPLVYATHLAGLREGTPGAEAPMVELPARDRTFLAAIEAALGSAGATHPPPFDAFLAPLAAHPDLEPLAALRATYARCAAQLSADDRHWLRARLAERLVATFPALDPPGAPALLLRRFDELAHDLAPAEAAEGRAIAALIGLLATPAARPRATGELPPVAPPTKGRVYRVNGQEIRVTERDDMVVNLAVGGTVGLFAFLFIASQLMGGPGGGILSPRLVFEAAVIVAVVGGGGWVAFTRLSMSQRQVIARITEDIMPYWKPLGAAVLGLVAGVGMMFVGMPGLGAITIAVCALVLWGYFRLR